MGMGWGKIAPDNATVREFAGGVDCTKGGKGDTLAFLLSSLALRLYSVILVLSRCVSISSCVCVVVGKKDPGPM